jgi:hypothetical protein
MVGWSHIIKDFHLLSQVLFSLTLFQNKFSYVTQEGIQFERYDKRKISLFVKNKY